MERTFKLAPAVRRAILALALLTGAGTALAHGDDMVVDPGASAVLARAEQEVMRDYPALVQAITRGGSFGSEYSKAIANQMYSRTNAAAIADAKAKLKIEPQGPRTWLLRFPFVNVAVFDTDEGLVLVDAGYAPAGPALRDALKKLSPRPVHTIIYTHIHADHAWGAWALLDAGPKGKRPRIVSTDLFLRQLDHDMRSYGLIARNNRQGIDDVPRKMGDAILPTLTFHDRTTLTIGGERFVLTHARGETEDQLWVAVPGRKVVVSADYYQDFMPNAGNGKRRQRYPEEWAMALRAMADQKPQRVLPMHGPALTDAADIQDRFTAHAAILESITAQVLRGLNAGLRRDEVIDQVALPAQLANRRDARELYVSAKDIARMVAKQYGGWWDDIPSYWSPAPMAVQARELAGLAGGSLKLVERAKALQATQPALAAQLADWAWLAAPDDPAVLQGALDVYAGRIGTGTTTQEALVYREHMVRLKVRLLELAGDAAPSRLQLP